MKFLSLFQSDDKCQVLEKGILYFKTIVFYGCCVTVGTIEPFFLYSDFLMFWTGEGTAIINYPDGGVSPDDHPHSRQFTTLLI